MQKQIQRLQIAIKKCEEGIQRVIDGEFPESRNFIYSVLSHNQSLYEKKLRRLYKLR